MLKFLEGVLAELARMAAMMGAGTASLWNGYQPKEPQILQKRK